MVLDGMYALQHSGKDQTVSQNAPGFSQNDDPYKLTFVYKTGISNQVNAPKKRTKITESMKDNLSKLSSSCTDEVKKMFPPCTTDEC